MTSPQYLLYPANVELGLFVLRGRNPNFAGIEGTRADWAEIAKFMKIGRAFISRRCAVKPVDGKWKFFSPCNAFDDSDYILIDVDPVLFSEHIEAVLAAYSDQPLTLGSG